MSRDDGFPIADVDSSLFADPKIRRLWIEVGRDQGVMCEAIVAFVAVLLASWSRGERVDLAGAAPTWLSSSSPAIASLVAVRLLDRSTKIPRASWERWYGPARDRREKLRSASAEGNRKRWGSAPVPPPAPHPTPKAIPRRSPPHSPSYPSDTLPSSPPARARDGSQATEEGPTSLAEALAGTRFAAEHRSRR